MLKNDSRTSGAGERSSMNTNEPISATAPTNQAIVSADVQPHSGAFTIAYTSTIRPDVIVVAPATSK